METLDPVMARFAAWAARAEVASDCAELPLEKPGKDRRAWFARHDGDYFAGNEVERWDSNEAQRQLWEKISAWDGAGDKPGLGVIGVTNLGKTRMVYERLWQLRETMRPLVVMTGFSLQSAIQNQWHCDDAKARLRRARECSTLFLDELGRSKMTEAVEGEIMDLIDHRYRKARRIVFTTNFVGKEIEDKMADKTGAMIRRLRDMCEMINVKAE